MRVPLQLYLAEPDQCEECYYIWIPYALFLSWVSFCETLNSEESVEFKRGVEILRACLKNPRVRGCPSIGVGTLTTLKLKLRRKGRVVRRGELQHADRQFAPKHLQLKHALKLDDELFNGLGLDPVKSNGKRG